MFSEKYGSTSKAVSAPPKTEFDVLKASHRFLREDEPEGGLSWEEQVAKKYYDNLYREYAVCDLKHYKTGNFALRWRTENEVVSGAGETTCGNTRCPLHGEHGEDEIQSALTTLELPFSYVEASENKFALVKVVLCEKCVKKLMWKRRKEKEKESAPLAQDKSGDEEEDRDDTQARGDKRERSERHRSRERQHRRKRDEREDERGSDSGGKDKHGRDREEYSSRKRRRRSLSRVPRAKSGSA